MHSTRQHNFAITRYHRSFSYRLEYRLINLLLPFIPVYITPNFLTFLAFISSVIISFLYILSYYKHWVLWIVNVFIILNWFGDSFDGRLAIHRKTEQKLLGFYLDHILDGISVLIICLGLTLSKLTNLQIWLILSHFFILFELHSALEAVTVHKFSISFGVIGPTECRIFLIFLNILYFLYGDYLSRYFGIKFFDAASILIGPFIICQFLITVLSTILIYSKFERKKLGK